MSANYFSLLPVRPVSYMNMMFLVTTNRYTCLYNDVTIYMKEILLLLRRKKLRISSKKKQTISVFEPDGPAWMQMVDGHEAEEVRRGDVEVAGGTTAAARDNRAEAAGVCGSAVASPTHRPMLTGYGTARLRKSFLLVYDIDKSKIYTNSI